jgi:hypothetical protein
MSAEAAMGLVVECSSAHATAEAPNEASTPIIVMKRKKEVTVPE